MRRKTRLELLRVLATLLVVFSVIGLDVGEVTGPPRLVHVW